MPMELWILWMISRVKVSSAWECVMSYRANSPPALQSTWSQRYGSSLVNGVVSLVKKNRQLKKFIARSNLSCRQTPLTRRIIALDCVNLAALPLSVLRSCISCILQDTFLLSGTIRWNLEPRNEYVRTELCLPGLPRPFVQAMSGIDAQLKNNWNKLLLCDIQNVLFRKI